MSGVAARALKGSQQAPPEFLEAFARVKPRLRHVGTRLVFFATVGSTNDVAIALASDGEAIGAVVDIVD